MMKPWWKSISIVGAITTAVGYISDPRVLDVLGALPIPEGTRAKVTGVITGVGVVATIFGLRRALPDVTLIKTAAGDVAVHDATGGAIAADLATPRNVYGETPDQEAKRRAIMDAEGAELRRTLEAQGR